MDQDLIAYLDQRFRETVETLRMHTGEMVETLRAHTDERFRETSQQIQELRDEVRYTQVRVEDLQGQIRLVAEGVAGVGERLESFRTDVRQEFDEVRGLIQQSYSDLDRRVQVLEAKAS
jgi:predicted  nucleic acid-binding Zn-ribbon protein